MKLHVFPSPEEKDDFHQAAFENISPIVLGTPECDKAVESITHSCKTAEELLHELTLSKDRWDPPHVQTSAEPENSTQKDLRINKENLIAPWYFRGQANAKWDLLPKPWRSDSATELSQYSASRAIVTPAEGHFHKYDLLDIECDLLTRYERTLEQTGYSLSHLTREEKQRRDDRTEPNTYPYFYHDKTELISDNLTPLIAQHHGLPTRLLDITSKPFVSAFMACRGFYESEEALKGLREEGQIAIWAFSWESISMSPYWINFYGDGVQETDFAKSILKGRFRLEYPSASSDERIKAQGGLFTYSPSARQFIDAFHELPSLEGFLINTGLLRIIEPFMPADNRIDLRFKRLLEQKPAQLFKELSSGQNFKNTTYPYFRKLTLPYSQVHKVMECLDAMGINESSLFPGIQQASTTLRHRTLRNRAMGCEGGYDLQVPKIESLGLSQALMDIVKNVDESKNHTG